MITDFDDYLIHQAALPINQMGIVNRNAYDRYWFNGFDRSGTFLFEAGSAATPTVSCRTLTSASRSMESNIRFTRRGA